MCSVFVCFFHLLGIPLPSFLLLLKDGGMSLFIRTKYIMFKLMFMSNKLSNLEFMYQSVLLQHFVLFIRCQLIIYSKCVIWRVLTHKGALRFQGFYVTWWIYGNICIKIFWNVWLIVWLMNWIVISSFSFVKCFCKKLDSARNKLQVEENQLSNIKIQLNYQQYNTEVVSMMMLILNVKRANFLRGCL